MNEVTAEDLDSCKMMLLLEWAVDVGGESASPQVWRGMFA